MQVTLDPEARAAAGVPPSSQTRIDALLEGLAAFARADRALELRGLCEVVERLPPGRRTAIEVHVGALDASDLHEASALEAAVRAKADAGLTCRVHVHADGDHNLVRGMRDRGELHRLLVELVGPTSPATAGIPDGFVGFEDCPDF